MGNSFTHLCIEANCAWLFLWFYRRWNLNQVWCRKRASPTTLPIVGATTARYGNLKWKIKNVSWFDYTKSYDGLTRSINHRGWQANRNRDFLIRSHLQAKNKNFNKISQIIYSYNPSINLIENMNQSICLQNYRKAFQRPKAFTLQSRNQITPALTSIH